MNYLSVCTILRNEEKYSYEWVSHLINQGVERLYLYDNSVPGEPDQKAPLREFLNYITWHDAPGRPRQRWASNHAINMYKKDTELLLFIDVDEFPYSKKHPKLIETLPEYFKDKSVDALAIHWILFGSSGHEEYAPEPVVKRFTWREATTNPHVKSICRLANTITQGNDVHSYRVKGKIIDENFKELPKDYALSEPATSEIFALNHYVTKSRQECLVRRSMPRCDTGIMREPGFFEAHNFGEYEDLYLYNLNGYGKENR